MSAAEFNRGGSARPWAANSWWSAQPSASTLHTVGIDLHLNVKGHAGENGLESYAEIRVVTWAPSGGGPTWSTGPGGAPRTRCWSPVRHQRDAHIKPP